MTAKEAARALHPYPDDLVIATKGGLTRRGPIQAPGSHPAVTAAATHHGADPRQVVLAWLLARSPQMLPIPGAGSVAHLDTNVAAAGIQLSQAEVAAITDSAQ
jgi:aryl-alcohol dehydrogenase-like predicted oxidoreductase